MAEINIRIKSTDIAVYLGQKESGKTYLCMKALRVCKKYIVYDGNWEYSKLGHVVHDLETLKAQYRTSQKIIYQPLSSDVEDFEKVAKFVWDTGNMIFVVEEAERYISFSLPRYTSMIVNSGRHRGIGLWANTRRCAYLNKTVIANSQHIFIFFTFLPQDIKYIKEFLGEQAEQVTRLKGTYKFLYYDHVRTILHNKI